LIGKTCKCSEHQHPLDHFNIKPDTETEVKLTLNGVEVPGPAGFLQAYFRQSESLIANRARDIYWGSFKNFSTLIDELISRTEDALGDYTNSNTDIVNLKNRVKELNLVLEKKLNELLSTMQTIEKSPTP
jgi:hypothetical protein